MSNASPSKQTERLLDAETKDVQVDTVAAHWSLSAESRKALADLFWKYRCLTEPVRRELGGGENGERVRASGARDLRNRTVVYLSYENPWGSTGGVLAVARMLPTELRNAGEHVIRISPLHHRLVTASGVSRTERLGVCPVRYDKREYPVTVYRCVDKSGEEWILFENTHFFDADGGLQRNDPYVFSDEDRAARDGQESKLLRDALFASKAVPAVLRVLKSLDRLKKHLVVHLQDWEFACAALTVKEALLDDEAAVPLQNISVVLTLHNPYDHGLSKQSLRKISRRCHARHWPPVGMDDRETVLTRMIPLTDAPVSTVSRVFAQEFTRDPLQTGYFAGHYQEILEAQKIVGIDNGLFVASGDDPDPEMAQRARQGMVQAILRHKTEARHTALSLLPAYLRQIAGQHDQKVYGRLSTQFGDSLADLPDDVEQLPDDVPLFMMVGRLDPGQKGFDLFARAIESMPRGAARYVISPLSPMAFDPDIGKYVKDLIELATETRPGEVLVLPFRLDPDVYLALRGGASWSVWPSLYEPFGGVTEFYLAGTPVVARAAGGLSQQVIDYRVDPLRASGILYHEPVGDGLDMERQHKDIQDAEFPTGGETLLLAGPRKSGILSARSRMSRTMFKLYRQMVHELAQAMKQAVHVYRQCPDDYGRMLGNLPLMSHYLSWQRSVEEYRRWYDLACR